MKLIKHCHEVNLANLGIAQGALLGLVKEHFSPFFWTPSLKENYYRLMHSPVYYSFFARYVEYLHPAQVKVSHEAILPEKENLVQFFRRETGAMVSGD